MQICYYDYELPPERIAQEAVEPRDAARLMHVLCAADRVEHLHVRDLPQLMSRGDLLVVNDAQVVPARLIGRKATGGRVELLLLERRDAGGWRTRDEGEIWRVQVGASRAPAAGTPIDLDHGFQAVLIEGPLADGTALVRIAGAGSVEQLMERSGQVPLPPYIRREENDPRSARDRERYQTIYAAVRGAVAAPTAGLHFTPGLLRRLADRGVAVASLTLHVGEGTFRPLRVERTEQIELHPERYELSQPTADAIHRAREAGGRVVAVGTTVVRALESRPQTRPGVPAAGAGSTSLCLLPGHEFRYVDALLTNFHLPRSTLLMLVSAFAGRERLLSAYRVAIEQGYRFYSYGDAMLVYR